MPPPAPGAHVTTFYSFKGGVGRSLLLANVGWQLAEHWRVLLWDLDVEAPGLHRIPALDPGPVKEGFFEWLTALESPAGSIPPKRGAALRRRVRLVPRRPNLSILPAFGEGADFARLYAEGIVPRLLVDEPAASLKLFRSILAVLAEGHDHVLIDSRTGVTDIGGLLAAVLPHATVLVGSYGHQSVLGLAHVRRALEPAAEGRLVERFDLGEGARLSLLHVISPVPAELEESELRRRVWREKFGDVEPVEIPFDPRLLWGELLLADKDPRGSVAQAYARLSERIAALRDDLAASAAELRTAAEAPEGDRTSARDSRVACGLRFEDRVARLLELHGYAVEREQLIAGHRVDLVARISGGLDEQCWWVECKDHRGAVGKEILEKLAAWIDGKEGRRQGARGMVVARRFTPAALAFAADRTDLKAWTVDDLERRLFDPRPYLNSLVASFESSVLGRTYVAQRVLLEGRPEEEAEADLLDHAVAWVQGKGPRLWLLLGDYGTGKSAFFQRFAVELARKALEDPEAPFPVAIDLKLCANATSAETLLFEHLRSRVPSFRGDPAALLHLLSSGRCVLLLDAFDEMGVAAAGRGVEEQFRELARLAGTEPLDQRGNRVLLTCRTHFFRDQQQVKDTAAGLPVGLGVSEDSALGRIARRYDPAIDELCLFDDAQIAEFLERHLGAEPAAKARGFIAKTYDLNTLASRPVLLELIVKSLPALWKEGEGRVTSAGLYEIYTRQWLEDTSRNLQTRPELRHRLLTLLASALWKREDRQIHHRDLLEEVRKLSGHFPGLDFERVDVELRTAAFLVRSADGYYRFSHKSFLEFFLARGLLVSLASGESAAVALALPPLSHEVARFFWQLASSQSGPDRVLLGSLEEVLISPYRPCVSENALRLLALNFTRLKYHEDVEIRRAQLGGARLEGALLIGVQLPEAELRGADLTSAWLSQADLRHSRIEGARFDHAQCTEIILEGADLTAAVLTNANLRGAVLRHAQLDRATLAAALLDQADLAHSSIGSADMQGASGHGTRFASADLRSARFEGSTWTDADFSGALLPEAGFADCLLVNPVGLPKDFAISPHLGRNLVVAIRMPFTETVRSVAWSPDGRSLAAAMSAGSARAWEVASGQAQRIVAGLTVGVRSVAWSPEGARLALGSDDGWLRVWNIEEGAIEWEIVGVKGILWSIAWSPDGSLLAAGGEEEVRIWDAGTGQLQWEVVGLAGVVSSLAWSALGQSLVGVSGTRVIRLREDGRAEFLLGAEETGAGGVWPAAWSPDGITLALGCADGSVRFWDLGTQRLRRSLPGSWGVAWSISWSPDGALLAAGYADGTVRLWDLKRGQVRKELVGSRGRIWSVSWAPDGGALATVGEDVWVRLWDAKTGCQRAVFSTQAGVSVAAVPGGWYEVSYDFMAPSVASLYSQLRLYVAEPGPPQAPIWKPYPLAGLGKILHNPEAVRAALAGKRPAPPKF